MPILDDIVEINITRQNVTLGLDGLDTILIIGESNAQEGEITMSEYTSLTQVAESFAVQSPEYQCASLIFGQEIKPKKIIVAQKDLEGDFLEAYQYMIAYQNRFYGVICVGNIQQAELIQICQAVEASKKLILTTSSQEAALVTVQEDTSSLAKALFTLKLNRSVYMFSYMNNAVAQYPNAAWAGLELSKSAGTSNWAYKTLSGIAASNLSDVQRHNLEAKNANYYIDVANKSITYNGKVSSGEWIDVIRGIDWITNNIKIGVFNLLISTQKVAMTNEGIASLEHSVRAVLTQAAENGILLKESIVITSPTISEISLEDKANRRVPITFNAKLANAINLVAIQGTITY